jgi:SAM-dependent methyltransferase
MQALKSIVIKTLSRFNLELRRTGGYRYHLYEEADKVARPYYNIGAGSFFHPNWTNIDFVSDWYEGVQQNVINHDLMSLSPLPIATGTAKVIYTSHTIEHVSESAVQTLLQESYRCLRPGGFLRVTTGPDADSDYAALMRGDDDWFYWDKHHDRPGTYEEICRKPQSTAPLEERWLHHVASQLAPNDLSPSEKKFNASQIREILNRMPMKEALDYFTGLCQFQPSRPGNHITWWNHEKLEKFVRTAGFTTVYRSGYAQSHCPVLRQSAQFDSTHPQMSLYIEAMR